MYKELLQSIESYDKITIFRHKRPDGDAVFSSNGLKAYIEHNFKNKKVKLCGFEDTYDTYSFVEKVSNSFIKDSLAIILDVSNEDRTDDNRYSLASKRIIIDHHPGNPTHAEIKYIDTTVSATCELLAKIFYSSEFKRYALPEETCKFLYCGILTDTNSFKTVNTTYKTLNIASKLAKDGNLKISDLSEFVFTMSTERFLKITKFRKCIKIDKNVGYMILDQKKLDNLGLTCQAAKNNVDQFNTLKDINIWAVYAYNKDTGLYDGSVRSKRNYVINTLCNNYNGGGHKNACGVKALSLKQVKQMLNDLKELANQ